MKKLRKSFVVMVLFFPFYCWSYFYQLSCLEKIFKNTDNKQIIIGLGDYHDKSNSFNSSQRLQLISLLQEFSSKKIKVIVEDLSSSNNDGRLLCCRYAIKAYGGVLGSLATTLRKKGVNVDNIEYRYCRVAALGPLLMHYIKKPPLEGSSHIITFRVLRDEIMHELEKIRLYDDGKFLNKLYKTTIVSIEEEMKKLKFDKKDFCSIAHYFNNIAEKNYIKKLEELCVFDSALIDMNILHSIVTAQDKEVIFVIAGGSHIEKINDYLMHLGYKKVKFPLQNKEENLSSINSTIGSSQRNTKPVIRPKAIDLSIITDLMQ